MSVLVVDLAGLATAVERADPDAVTEQVEELWTRFDRSVRRYEGRPDRGVNGVALAIFGAPDAHEDDPERAARAALEILDPEPRAGEAAGAPSLGVAPRAAVATGRVVVGQIGEGAGARYAVFGEVVEVCRGMLTEASGGELHVDEATSARLAGRAQLEALEPIALRGRASEGPRLTPRFRLTGWRAAEEVRPQPTARGPLIGRDPERAALVEALQQLREGQAGVVAVTGPAGTGKSRLVREVLSVAGPWTVHVGRCISYGRSIPLHLWSEIAASLLALPGALAALEALDAADQSGGRRREAAEWLAAGSRAQLLAETGVRPRSRAFEGLSDLLIYAASAGPVVLVLEDLHWADATSFELLAALLARVRALPVLVIALRRSDGPEDEDPRLAQAARRVSLPFQSVPLDPLSPEHTRALIDALLGAPHDLPEAALERLVQLSDGVPLFADELLRQLREQGALAFEGDRWRYNPSADAEDLSVNPDNFAVLAVRVDRLDAELRAALELAAALGPEFDPAVVDAVLGETLSRWTRLEAAGLILGGEDLATSGARLRFRQPLTRELIYGSLSQARRQHSHQLVVDLAGHALRPAERAWHLQRAGRPAEAGEAWAEAARQARGLDVVADAIDLFERASRAHPDVEIQVAPELAGMLMRAGRLSDAIALADRLTPRLREADLPAVLTLLLSTRAYLAYRTGDGPGIVRHAEDALEAAERCGEPLAIADALRNLGIGYEFTGRVGAAREAWQRVVTMAQGPAEVPLRRIVINVYNSLGELCRMEGRYAEALAYYDQSRDSQQRLAPRPYNLIWLINTSAALVGLRRYDEALKRSAEALRLVEASGARGVLPEVLVNHALALDGAGKTAEARDAAKRARDEAERQGQEEILGIALRVYGLLKLKRGEDAIASLSESVARLAGAGKTVDEARSRAALAAAIERSGDLAGATRERERAARLLKGVGLDSQAEAMFRAPRRLMALAMAPAVESAEPARLENLF